MVELSSLLTAYVNRESNVVDLQIDPQGQPSLPIDPYSADRSERKKIAHYFLLIASVDEGNVVGLADNARKLIVALYSVLKEELYTSDDKGFQEALKDTNLKLEGRLSRLIPSILGSANSFVKNIADGDLVLHSAQLANPLTFAEEIATNIYRMGRTSGSTRKKTWMYLRWMVRNRPDLRLFDDYDPKDLFVPVDRNVGRVAVCAGRIPQSHLISLTWNDTLQVTKYARELFPEDPVKVDYPFFLLGRKLSSRPSLNEQVLLSAITE
jgi:hypothetical protein